MQRNFDNNINNLSDIYNTINNTNLIVATLPTKTDVSTSITNNNLNYTTSLLTTTLINNNIISNNLLYTNTTNLNILLANAVTSRDAAIALSKLDIIITDRYNNIINAYLD